MTDNEFQAWMNGFASGLKALGEAAGIDSIKVMMDVRKAVGERIGDFVEFGPVHGPKSDLAVDVTVDRERLREIMVEEITESVEIQ